MREQRTEMVAFVVDENLRLVCETPEGRGVDNAVTVALERRAVSARRLGCGAPTAQSGVQRPGRDVPRARLPRRACPARCALPDAIHFGHLPLPSCPPVGRTHGCPSIHPM